MRQSTLDGFESTDYTDPEDPDWLRKAYFEDNLTLSEMADAAGVGYGKIYYHMEKHGIERRSSGESRDLRGTHRGGYSEIKKHNTKDWLKQKYFGEKLTVTEMAEEADVSDATIVRNMADHDLKTRPSYVTRVMRDPGAGFVHADHAGGYETIKHSVGDHTYNYKIHRLLAIAEFGIEAVKGKLVHHGRESHLPAADIPWANWGGNLELVDGQAEHATHHDWGAHLANTDD